ncbi:hypothetical protein F3J20_26920 [Paraburkholderia sp. Cy-641]|uniref:virulence factor TspB C-terminal domain-related protein n=1 Tax=Paraburkholderia sp. Cy-641 TaxID=2608337 RepID=UPI00141F74DF|nr:hypothetical protein [Paraburkholderia sp. Cy-641]
MGFGVRFGSFILSCGVLLFGILFTAPHDVAYAQQTPSGGSGLINRIIEKTVESKAAQLGIGALDSVVGATEAAMSAAAGAAGAGAWLGVLASVAGPLGLLTQPTPLGDGSLTAWQLNHDGTVSVSHATPDTSGDGSASPFSPLQSGAPYFCVIGGQGSCAPIYGSSAEAILQESMQQDSDNPVVDGVSSNGCDVDSNGSGTCSYTMVSRFTPAAGEVKTMKVARVSDDKGFPFGSCDSGMYGDSGCVTYETVRPLPPVTESGSSASSGVPSSDLDDPLSPIIVAALADALWESASQQSGYSGIPYPASNPITSADTGAIESSSPSNWPSVGSASSPASTPSGASSPFQITSPSSGTDPGTGTGTDPGTGTGTDPGTGSGTDPGTGDDSGSSPSDTPDLCQLDPSIIACQQPGSATAPTLPSSDATVSVTPVTVGASDGVCPSPVSITVFGMGLSFSYQPECDFMSRVRPFVLAACGIIAALIFGAGLKS